MNLTVAQIMTNTEAALRLRTTYWLCVAVDTLRDADLTIEQADRLEAIRAELRRRNEA